jgi:SAM-dependent methyltransferase
LGDELDWRWSRELVLDALPEGSGPFHVLDVGCANGYLMQSLEHWGSERALRVVAHGLEISARLVSLARRLWPERAERLSVGNLLDWAPPRRYDLVHTALDYVPPARWRAAIERLRRDLLAPGGRIVLRAERAPGGEADPVQQLAELGLSIGGVLERRHPRSGALRRTAWLGA